MSEPVSYSVRLEEIEKDALDEAGRVYQRFRDAHPDVDLTNVGISKRDMWDEVKSRVGSDYDGFTLKEIAEAKFFHLSNLLDAGQINAVQSRSLRRFRDFFVGPTVNLDYFKSASGELPYNPAEIFEICSARGNFEETLDRFTEVDFLRDLTAPLREAGKKKKEEENFDEEDDIL